MRTQEVAKALFSGEAQAMDYYEKDKLGPERWVYQFEDGTCADVFIRLVDEDGWPLVTPQGGEAK